MVGRRIRWREPISVTLMQRSRLSVPDTFLLLTPFSCSDTFLLPDCLHRRSAALQRCRGFSPRNDPASGVPPGHRAPEGVGSGGAPFRRALARPPRCGKIETSVGNSIVSWYSRAMRPRALPEGSNGVRPPRTRCEALRASRPRKGGTSQGEILGRVCVTAPKHAGHWPSVNPKGKATGFQPV
jgi:hypothetical protein